MQRFIILFLVFLSQIPANGQSAWVRINQLGYLPNSVKVAVFISKEEINNTGFQVKEQKTGRIVFNGEGGTANAERWGMKSAFRLNFSTLERPGEYYIECNGAKSPAFRIDSGTYKGSADFILNYMRQQRCGFNPYLDTLCHQHDGFIVDHPTRSGEKIDVRGGWHDASDCLQYLPTSANAVFQMLFAWQQTPDKTIFKDEYDAWGKKGTNGIPDILDEIRWGLEWMLKMNPAPGIMFNQIADDRDHAGIRIPSYDIVNYGWGPGTGRPVYFITGKSQGLRQHKNRTEGVSSSAAKFASAFTLGAKIFENIDPAFASILKEKSDPAYVFAESDLGCTQTACVVSPYFYEEDNYVDDMELAAIVKYTVTSNSEWLKKADYWGQLEDITPWMELGRARHYQFYPFVNLGHFYLSLSGNAAIEQKYIHFMKRGLDCLLRRAEANNDPFFYGIPFIWCSNNLVVAAITQARLYYQTSGDDTYLEMEAALRDWLFGCNPWGTSMICGLPETGISPRRTHSYVTTLMKDITKGGLVDGPVYRSIYENLLGIELYYEDPFVPFQFGEAIYHDDPGDYSSNEPTMDGTASLSFYLSTMEKEGKLQKSILDFEADTQGAMVKINPGRKAVHLIFSADTVFEGGDFILQTLNKNNVKASFFLTGNCLREKTLEPLINQIIKQGHYIGGHSDNHLLYAPWDNRRQSLVSADSLINDFRKNISELEKYGINTSQLTYFLPPYEYYNKDHVRLIRSLGQILINYTPGISTAADYTTPDMSNYKSSQELIDQLFAFEEEHSLEGSIILIHPGTHESRTDKLYLRLDEIIQRLKKKGYHLERFPEDGNRGMKTAQLEQKLSFLADSLTQHLKEWEVPVRVFNVKNYGAIGDGKTVNTVAIQKAIDACFAAGGGTVQVSAGEYVTGTVELKSNVMLEVTENARILGSTDLTDYPEKVESFKSVMSEIHKYRISLIYAEKAENTGICGKGEINFRGEIEYFPGPETIGEIEGRPFGIRMIECRNVVVKDITLRNAAAWMQSYLYCENLIFDGITVFNHVNHNNDGLDPDGCRNVIVRNCFISSHDDAMCLKGASAMPCENILIENSAFYSTCNAFKLGTDTQGDFRNIIARHLVLGGPADSLESFINRYECSTGITLATTDGGNVENIWIRDVEINRSRCPVFIRIGSRGRRWNEPMEQPGYLKNIVIENVTGMENRRQGSFITGIKDRVIENVLIKNMDISMIGGGAAEMSNQPVAEDEKGYPDAQEFSREGLPAYGFYIRHAKNITLENVKITPETEDQRPAFQSGENIENVIVNDIFF